MLPTGDISVMPQAWIVSTPYFSRKAVIIDGGQAEPPTTVRCRLSSLLPILSASFSSPSQMVGTPSASDTWLVSISFTSDGPSRPGPGITIAAPTMAQA